MHTEAKRYAADGYTIVLIGHEGHEEVVGTMGEAPESIRLIGSVEEIADLEIDDPTRVAYITQTTLSVDETLVIIDALRERFPQIVGPKRTTSATRPRTARTRSSSWPARSTWCW